MKKKAELFTADRLIEILENMGNEFGYKVDNDTDYDIENTTTISYLGDDDKLYLLVVVLHGGIYTKINIFDQNNQNIFSKSVRASNFDIKEYRDVMDKVYLELGKNIKFLLNTPEKIYDYGEENNWQGLEQKHYEILSQDKSLAQMAVADMQDKEIVIPETLKQFRRYSMSFKDVVISKIAKEKIATKKVARATKVLKKAMGPLEKKQIGALDDNAVGKYNLYQGQGEFYITKRKLKDWFALMDTADTLEDIIDKMEKGFGFEDNYVVYDKELFDEYDNLMYGGALSNQMEDDSEEAYEHMWFYNITDLYDDTSKSVKTNKKQTMYRKAAEEDLDVKLKVQKNKPSGLDTSSPQILEGKTKKVFEDMMKAALDLNDVKADIEKFKAKTDKLIQKKIQKVGLDEKTARLQELTNKSASLLGKMANIAFQNNDKFGVFIDKIQTVPKKFTDKEKIAKLMEFIDKEIGKGRAEQYLKNAENGLQSQATEKAIKELVVFEPTKQQKTSATNDEESSIDTLLDTMKEVYTNLRNYYLSMVKVNNVIEDELLPTVTASKKSNVSKKAKVHKKAMIIDIIWDRKDGANYDTKEFKEYVNGWKGTLNADEIIKALDSGTEEDVKRELCRYIVLGDYYSPETWKFINSVNWLEKDNKKSAKVNKKAKMHKKAADNKVRIFLTNLGKYNEGELVGEWVDLPVQNFKPILNKIGIDGKNYEEVFITDYEAPFEIGEYENINELNNKVKRIETLDEEQKDVLYSVMGNWSEEDFDKLFKKVEGREYFYVPQGNVNPEFYGTDATGPLDLAVGYIEQLGGVGSLDEKTIDAYFDYNKYGEYLESMGFEPTEKGYVQF